MAMEETPPAPPGPSPAKKVDEDWKERVRTERERREQGAPAPRPAGTSPGPAPRPGPARETAPRPGPGPSRPSRPAPARGRRGRAHPEASLLGHVENLATQALIALGEVAHPMTGRPEPDIDQARYLIDTLDVLKAKTAGNLDAQEQEALDGILYDLRMRYVEATGGGPA